MLGLLLSSSVVLLSTLAGTTFAKDCSTHTFTTCPSDGIVHWYDPDDGMICDPLDCGGGRAPPKTDVPGCAGYKGTSTRATTPSYLPCWPFTTSTPTTVATPTNTAAVSSTSTAVPSTAVTSTSTPIGSLTPTTSPASLPTNAPSNGTQSTGNTPPPPKSTSSVPSAGNLVKNSLMAVMVIAGTAIGASTLF